MSYSESGKSIFQALPGGRAERNSRPARKQNMAGLLDERASAAVIAASELGSR
ncbi:hypothetical protein ACFLUG_00710 [Chloroflexota bacterium]